MALGQGDRRLGGRGDRIVGSGWALRRLCLADDQAMALTDREEVGDIGLGEGDALALPFIANQEAVFCAAEGAFEAGCQGWSVARLINDVNGDRLCTLGKVGQDCRGHGAGAKPGAGQNLVFVNGFKEGI